MADERRIVNTIDWRALRWKEIGGKKVSHRHEKWGINGEEGRERESWRAMDQQTLYVHTQWW